MIFVSMLPSDSLRTKRLTLQPAELSGLISTPMHSMANYYPYNDIALAQTDQRVRFYPYPVRKERLT